MKKEEFIKKLREKLDILEETEIQDIVEEYLGYIDEKIKKGATEEEAIKDFGEIDELANELLKAYKINVDHQKKPSSDVVNKVIDKFMSWIDGFIKQFENKSGTDILRMIIEIFLILLIIGLCKIPFSLLRDLGYDVFMVFNNGIGKALYHIWKFVIEFSYLIVAIVLFIKIFEKRYFQNKPNENQNSDNLTETTEKNKKKTTRSNEEKSEVVIEKTRRHGFIDALATICIWFIKFIAICILIGVGGYIIGMAVAVGLGIYALIQGVTYYGIFISLVVLLSLGCIFFEVLFNFIFNKKTRMQLLLGTLLVNIILLGFSFSFASIEIANTEFINEMPANIQQKEHVETLKMKEEYIFVDYIKEFVVDETLTDEIKIGYNYYDMGNNIDANIRIKEKNEIRIDWNYNDYHWNKNYKNLIIEDLKKKQLHNYDNLPKIKVYANSKNIEILKENKEKYENERKSYMKKSSYCKAQYYNYGYNSLSKECQEVIDWLNL